MTWIVSLARFKDVGRLEWVEKILRMTLSAHCIFTDDTAQFARYQPGKLDNVCVFWCKLTRFMLSMSSVESILHSSYISLPKSMAMHVRQEKHASVASSKVEEMYLCRFWDACYGWRGYQPRQRRHRRREATWPMSRTSPGYMGMLVDKWTCFDCTWNL